MSCAANVQSEYPIVGSIATHVLKYGPVSADNQKGLNSDVLVLIIPGNPGVIEFYDEFMKRLHEKTSWPVWGISHAGHTQVPKNIHNYAHDSAIYTLDGQIQHKIAFINKFIPENVRLVLIGHSIGAYMVLQILREIDERKVLQAYLLMPTIERVKESPRGRMLAPLVKYMRSLLAYAFKRLKRKGKLHNVSACIQKGAINLLNPRCMRNIFYISDSILHQVSDLDTETLERHLEKLRFYYGATDYWAPQEYYYNMKGLYPAHEHIYLCEKGFRHAFIIDNGIAMADLISQWLLTLQNQL